MGAGGAGMFWGILLLCLGGLGVLRRGTLGLEGVPWVLRVPWGVL